jgi:hypothetical protein
MTLDQRLARAAHHVADRLAAPDVDLDAVRARARSNRRRTTGIAVAATVAAALAVSVPLLADRDGAAPAPVAPPAPPAVGSDVVWLDAAGLHRGNRVLTTAAELPLQDLDDTAQVALALVRRGVLYNDPSTGDVWFHPWSGGPRVIGRGSVEGPGGDPDGSIAVWFEDQELVVYDTAREREISRTSAAPAPWSGYQEHRFGNGFLHVSADEVVWSGGDRNTRLDLRTGELSRHDDLADVHEDVRVEGIDGGALTIDVAGQARRQLPGFEPRLRLSSDGSYLLAAEGAEDSLQTDGSHGAAIVEVRTGRVWKLRDEDFSAKLAWGYGDTALVTYSPGGYDPAKEQVLLACDASERTCNAVPHEGVVVTPTS